MSGSNEDSSQDHLVSYWKLPVHYVQPVTSDLSTEFHINIDRHKKGHCIHIPYVEMQVILMM